MSHRAGWNRVVLAADVRERQLDRITETQFSENQKVLTVDQH